MLSGKRTQHSLHHNCFGVPLVLLPAGKKLEGVQIPADQQPVFSISPDKVLVPAKESTTFLISGVSSKAGGPGRLSWVE